MSNDTKKAKEKQALSREAEQKLVKFLSPLFLKLNTQLDRRLVKNFLGLVMAIMQHRHRNHGLVLSELGGFLLGSGHCCAGTKRIHNLLSSPKWDGNEIEAFHWKKASQHVSSPHSSGKTAFIAWDESVIEKAESLQAEHLCAVRSSKALRLKRIKPGYFNPPGGRPVFVPGFQKKSFTFGIAALQETLG